VSENSRAARCSHESSSGLKKTNLPKGSEPIEGRSSDWLGAFCFGLERAALPPAGCSATLLAAHCFCRLFASPLFSLSAACCFCPPLRRLPFFTCSVDKKRNYNRTKNTPPPVLI